MRPYFLAFCWLVVNCNNHFAAETAYTAQLLKYEHHPLDLNDHGEMAGEYRGTIQHGVYFDGTNWFPRGNGDHYSWSTLSAINNNHAAVGLNSIPPQLTSNLVVHAVRVEPNGTLVNLGSLTGPNGNARARGINDLNVAVGDSLNASGKRVAVRFETNGAVSDLSLGVDSSSAIDINNRGDIIGDLISASGVIRGFFIPWDSIPKDIGTLGGTETFVTRINARGDIVGKSKTKAGLGRAFIYTNGEMKDLGTLGGEESVAYGINDAGVIVGGAMKTNGAWSPFIKFPGQPMIDLADLVTLPQVDTLISATAINNHGQILVRGWRDESDYLFKPVGLTWSTAGEKIHLRYTGPPNLQLRIDTADTLPNWHAVSTNTLNTEPVAFEFPLTSPAMFFRATLSAGE